MELHLKYRPTMFKHLVGQNGAVASLQKLLKKRDSFPHAILLTGPSGCGKTTIARILKTKLNCADGDFREINAADFNGVNTIREIRTKMYLSPSGGDCRIWLLDEAHQCSSDAQDAMLKMLEDAPRHVYFMLATTNPGKLKETIQTRCHQVQVQSLTDKVMVELLNAVCEKEKLDVSGEVVDQIVECANGSARKALVLLNQVMLLDTEEEQLEAIQKSDTKRQAIELARALLNPRAQWPAIAKLLKELDDEPETTRRLLLGYSSSVMLSGGKLAARAYLIATAMRENFYDSGKPGLITAVYEVFSHK